MNGRRLLAGLGWGLLALAQGCAPDTPRAPGVIDEIRAPVVNGQEASSCQWPSVVMVQMSNGLCSGTLVHPRVITLAAHCQTAGQVEAVYFGERSSAPARQVAVQRCGFYPGYRANVNDVGYCVLAEEVRDVPIAPLLMGCETAVLQEGRLGDIVGFGLQSRNRPFSLGIKRWGEVTLLDTPGPDSTAERVGGAAVSGCNGDSGGPLMVRLDDGTWRVVGVASTTAVDSNTKECIPPTSYVLLFRYAGWIEGDSGIDITPCHDADGTWHPSPACGRFSRSAEVSTASWASSCSGPRALSGAVVSPGCPSSDPNRPGDGGRPLARSDGSGVIELDGGVGRRSDAGAPELARPATVVSSCSFGGRGRPPASALVLALVVALVVVRCREKK